MKDYTSYLKKFEGKQIVVIGDLILDHYIQGSVDRISQEAPVPIVNQKREYYSLGGAANVANNLVELGAKPILIGRVGADADATRFLSFLSNRKIETKWIVQDDKVPTILKTRILAHNQQMLRIDRENKIQIDRDLHDKFFIYFSKVMKKADAIIISDYGKGMITSELISHVKRSALLNEVPIIIDPKVEHFDSYHNVTCITPNREEAENAMKYLKMKDRSFNTMFDRLDSYVAVVDSGIKMLNYLKMQSLLITLGEEGMILFEHNKAPINISAKAKQVYDVSGAGDTVVSIFSLCLASGLSKLESARIANLAAGVVVGKLGTSVITKKEMLEILK